MRLQTWRAVGKGEFEPWADFEFRIDAAKTPEKVELAAPDDPELIARGLRYRLLVCTSITFDSLLAPLQHQVIIYFAISTVS